MAIADENAVILLKRFGSLENQRQTWESHWQEIADYVVPRKADVTKKRSSGDKRTELVFDSTAIHAAELLSASLHGMLTNMARWFSCVFLIVSWIAMMSQGMAAERRANYVCHVPSVKLC